jgi:hypothetical protein
MAVVDIPVVPIVFDPEKELFPLKLFAPLAVTALLNVVAPLNV